MSSPSSATLLLAEFISSATFVSCSDSGTDQNWAKHCSSLAEGCGCRQDGRIFTGFSHTPKCQSRFAELLAIEDALDRAASANKLDSCWKAFARHISRFASGAQPSQERGLAIAGNAIYAGSGLGEPMLRRRGDETMKAHSISIGCYDTENTESVDSDRWRE
jgi:hypothetical protein